MIEIVETHVFTRLIQEHLEESDYRALQWALVARPDQGSLIPGGNGLRKLRWVAKGRGKRGGLRILYFWDRPASVVYMLFAYSKSEQEDLTRAQIRVLARLIDEELK